MVRRLNMCNLENVRIHFESEAPVYDGLIEKLIPRYREMVSALTASFPFEQSSPIKVLDIGCGTGTLIRAVIDRFPAAGVTALDFSGSMLEQARSNLKGMNVRFILQDYSIWNWDQPYDAIVSSLALHHLRTDDAKKAFYLKCFQHLNEGGVFVNADVVLASNRMLQNAYMSQWENHMLKSVSQEEHDQWIAKYHEEDVPVCMTDHLNWMTEAGFKHLDIVWKYFNFAVYCGYK